MYAWNNTNAVVKEISEVSESTLYKGFGDMVDNRKVRWEWLAMALLGWKRRRAMMKAVSWT